MVVDNRHSLIERERKGRTINVPYDYMQLMKSAGKSPSPFTVHYLTHDFFMDVFEVGPYTNIRPGKKTGDPTVTDVHVHCYKEKPEDKNGRKPIQYKLRFSDEWQDITVPRDFASKKVGEPKQLYKERLEVPKTKYNHLHALQAVISKDYHPFYDQLPYK
ncbi:ribosome-recycling factor [Elysia marginata]|uniref:Ribosome-recycling factor n=1 Tax=Elysia marginata TaxID=1093978 RepID=A0AAV4FH75_9GAST|nr:ribosome-recycling factor [Elysia marginata]